MSFCLVFLTCGPGAHFGPRPHCAPAKKPRRNARELATSRPPPENLSVRTDRVRSAKKQACEKWTLTQSVTLNFPSVTLNSLIPAKNSLFLEKFSLLICVGNCAKSDCGAAVSCYEIGLGRPRNRKIPCKIPCLAGNLPGDGCDQHCVASQAVRVSENFLL